MAASSQSAGLRVRSIDMILVITIWSVAVASAMLGLGAIYRARLGFDRPFAELLGLATIALPTVPLAVWLVARHRRALAEVGRAQRIERALLERGGDLVVTLDNDGAVVAAAGSLAERLGCSEASFPPGDWRRWMLSEDRDRCDAQLVRCLEQQAPGTIFYRGRGADGERLSIEATIFPLVDDRGRPDGFVVRHRDVSGTVDVRDELAEQSERMALAQRAGRVGVWEYTTADRRLVLSELLRHALGLPRDAAVPVDVARTWIDASQFARLEDAVRRSAAHDTDVSLTLTVVPPDGVERRFAISATTSRDTSGRIARVVGTAVDVTEQSRQRELLAKSEWMLVTLIEYAPLALVMCDRSLRCVRASRAWCERFLGQQPAAEGRLLSELLPGPWSHWAPRCAEALEGVRQRSDEDSVVVSEDPSGSGAIRWLRWEIIPWSGERGEIAGIIMTLEDVGPRKTAELEAAAARAALDASEAAAKVGSWGYDLRTGVVTWSRETYRLFGHDESSPAPDYAGILATYESSSAARLDAAVRRAVSEGIPYDIVLQLRAPTRGVRFVNARGQPILSRDSGGAGQGVVVEGLTGTVRDVTSEVEREEELRRAREAAEQGNRAKGEFLASMSHEIRTPLTAILGYAELLAADKEIQVDVQRRQGAAETIRNNAKHLLAIINDLLDLSKIEAGKLVIEHLPTNVAGVVADVFNLLGPAARAKGLSIASDSTIPARQLVLTDPIRLRQVLVNLVGNAIKFTERGSVTLSSSIALPATAETLDPTGSESREGAAGRIEVAKDQRRELVISVGDTGIGMTPETLQRIFGAFEQADASTSRKFGGTGLGLRISRRLVELLGGRLDVDSTYAAGSTFTLRIPVVLLPQR